jgi:AcrR family transcriptional regulator
MNGHDRRKQRIKEHIQNIALDLFISRSIDQVNMDEIAARAKVSKVTIYKYFHSKEELHKKVFTRYFKEILDATEKLLDSDMDFMEKFKITLGAKAIFPKVVDSLSFFEVFENVHPIDPMDPESSPKNKIRELMYRFYEQGKREGYIDHSLPFDLLYLYQQIFQAGAKAKAAEFEVLLANQENLEKFLNLFYFGIIQRKDYN